MKPMQRLLFCAAIPVALATSGCGHAGKILDVIVQAAQGVQYVSSLLDVAEGGAKKYLDRHPNMEVERAIDEHVAELRQAIALYNEAIAAGRDLVEIKETVLERYDALRKVMDEAGILLGRPPAGGPETDAPLPGPVELPETDLVAQMM